MNVHKDAFEHWTARDSADLYGIKDWGAGYFDINEKGELVVTAFGPKGPAVSLMEIVNGIQERGMDMPVLLRLRNILDTQIRLLHASFRKAIQQTNYTGQYRGVYPIKVNQHRRVIETLTQSGEPLGLEAGSKAELMVVLAHAGRTKSVIVCNGYKDREYIRMALNGEKRKLPN